MSSSAGYCQGLQSYLDPGRLIEPRILRLKLAPPPKKKNDDMGGWTFLQSLSTGKTTKENEATYIPPTIKRSSSMLSDKSLEMCTESLGSETGSDEKALNSPCNVQHETKETSRLKESRRKKRTAMDVPPPLTSITSTRSFQVTPHREGGRLVLEAVKVSSQAYFQAERVDGRLRLSLMKDCDVNEQDQGEGVESKGDEEEEEEYGEEVDENSIKVEDELGIGNLGRPRRCKEGGSNGNKGLLGWERKRVLVST